MKDATVSVGSLVQRLAIMLSLAALMASLALGCSSESPEAEEPVAAPAEIQTKALDDPEPDPASTPATIGEEDARALLTRWLAAQNAGDFAAYSALYATPMRGVRRSGQRVRRFDREGWLEDRRRMFSASMQVSASDVVATLSAHVAELRFVQDWASGRYHDVGPKRIVLVREGDDLRISLEEMERSDLVASSAPDPMALPDFAFVVEAGRAFVVLDDAPPADLGVGRTHLLSRGDPLAAALRRADRAKVSAAHRALLGERLALYGASGQICAGEVEGLHELRRFIPHFGQEQYWRGQDPEQGPRMTSEAVAAEVWQQGESGRLLVASVDAERCEGALFARGAAAPPVEMQGSRPSASPEAYVEAARTTRAYREQQRVYDGPDPWHLHAAGRAEVRVYGEGEGARHVVHMLAGMGCGDFGGALLQFYRDGASGPERLIDGSLIIHGDVLAVGDLDGDGVDEILVEELGPVVSVYRLDETGAYRAGTRLTTPYFDCGC